MTLPRVLVASLVYCFAIACIGGDAQTSLSDAAAVAPSGFLHSIDVVLDDSESPVVLGIRDGQTVAQAAVEFCQEQGLDETMQTALMPQLIKLLEDGIAEVLATNTPIADEATSLPLGVENTAPDPGAMTDDSQDSLLGEPLLTLGISLGGEAERTLFYYADQDPVDVAKAFCIENLVPSISPEELAQCTDSLSAHIVKTIDPNPSDGSPSQQELQQAQQQQQQQQQEPGIEEIQEQNAAPPGRKPLITVPLNLNGIETMLEIFPESHAMELASELCRREEFGLEESSMDSCLSQIGEIAQRAVTAYEEQEGKEQLQVENEPFTFKVPVTLAGLQLYAEYMTSETPRVSALRFCTQNLRNIESALGLEFYEGEEEEDTDGASVQGGEGFMSEGRESLREACTVVVEDAINAVLLGLRERVLEAEMMQANATDHGHDGKPSLSQDGLEGAEAWAASQVVADTAV